MVKSIVEMQNQQTQTKKSSVKYADKKRTYTHTKHAIQFKQCDSIQQMERMECYVVIYNAYRYATAAAITKNVIL